MGEITVASTTDTQEEIDKVVGVTEAPKPATGEGAEPSEPAAVAEPSEPTDHKSKSGFQKRIDKLTREKHEALGRIDQLATRLDKLEKGGVTITTTEAEKTVAAATTTEAADPNDPEPKEEDFQDYKEYVKAIARWGIRQEQRVITKKNEQAEAERARNAEAQKVFDTYNSRVTEARKQYDDWDEVLEDAARIKITPSMQVIIVNLENGPDVTYYLATHPEEANRIARMNDAQAAAQLGKLSGALEPTSEEEEAAKTAAPAKKPVSKAPAPIRPVGGNTTRTSVPLDEMDYQQYRKIRDQQVKARYQR